jgi:hypothetical protein
VYRSCTLDYRNHPVTAAPSARNQGNPVALGSAAVGCVENGDPANDVSQVSAEQRRGTRHAAKTSNKLDFKSK